MPNEVPMTPDTERQALKNVDRSCRPDSAHRLRRRDLHLEVPLSRANPVDRRLAALTQPRDLDAQGAKQQHMSIISNIKQLFGAKPAAKPAEQAAPKPASPPVGVEQKDTAADDKPA
jgi:hypothetical protein